MVSEVRYIYIVFSDTNTGDSFVACGSRPGDWRKCVVDLSAKVWLLELVDRTRSEVSL